MAADRLAQRGLRAQLMASMKFSTSRIDFSAFQTIQKTMASTLTGTVSRVSVDSAETLCDAHALVDVAAQRLNTGHDEEQPGPRSPT